MPATKSPKKPSSRRSFVRRLAAFEMPGVLSRSERAIVRLLVVGRSLRDVARARDTTVRTVSNQLSIIRRKIDLDAVRLASKPGGARSSLVHDHLWQRVLSGKLHLDGVVMKGPRVYALTSRRRGTHALLSARERETLALATSGCSIKEISQDLGVSPSSVDTYMRRGLRKLGLASREILEASSVSVFL